jgi:hypothetical protein
MSSGAIVSIAKAYHQGDRLTDQDIKLLNVAPGVWEKIKNATSLELAKNLSDDVRRAMGEALVSMRHKLLKQAKSHYKGMVGSHRLHKRGAKEGYADGWQAGMNEVSSAFPGLYNEDDFTTSDDGGEQKPKTKESSAAKMKGLGL